MHVHMPPTHTNINKCKLYIEKKEKHNGREVEQHYCSGIKNYEELEIALISCMAAAEEKTFPIRD